MIDPVLSLLSSKVDAYKNHAVRQALMQVMATAEKHNCAVLGVMHTVKAFNPNALFRSSSSSAFIEMSRTALFFVADPDGEQGQSGVIVNYKNNLGKHADSIRYGIHENEKHIGYISWEGVSPYTRDQLLNQENSTNNTKSEQEDAIITLLKGNREAMTAEEILPHTKQSLAALQMMLSRKVSAGIIWRTSYGKYTFVSNPLYVKDVKVVNVVSDVEDVTPFSCADDTPDSANYNENLNILTSDVKLFSGTQATPEDGSDKINNLNIENMSEPVIFPDAFGTNGHAMPPCPTCKRNIRVHHIEMNSYGCNVCGSKFYR